MRKIKAMYEQLKQQIREAIYENTEQDITGGEMQNTLLSMVDALGEEGYLFKGVANKQTQPGVPSGQVFYFATEVGEYPGFVSGGGIGRLSVAEGEVAIFKFNGTSWSKEATGIATKEEVDNLTMEVAGMLPKNSESDFAISDDQGNDIVQFNSGHIKTKHFDSSSIHNFYADTNNVLWLGTSIPASGQYPLKACQANGYECINMALGEACLTTTRARSLTAKVSEIEAQYGGSLSPAELEVCKNHSYERAVLPYINGTNIKQVSAIVIDHGYNDYQSIIQLMENQGSIDWNSTDRNNFVGAFNYLVNEIQKVNPFVKIVISGYFCYTLQSSNKPLGRYICELQKMLADKYQFELMDAWNYTQISFDKFVAGSSDYFVRYNQRYGTSITPSSWWYDASGNFRNFYLYCPDSIHPHSDKTGNANKRLNAVYTKLLKNIL